MDFSPEHSVLTAPPGSAVTMALIDGCALSQETLIKAFETSHPLYRIVAYPTPQSCVEDRPYDIEIIVFYFHGDDGSEAPSGQNLRSLRRAFPDTPVVVLSDAKDAHHPGTIRNALKCGANGFIPTRVTGLAMTLAAVRFVKEGGTFAPLDLLLPARTDRDCAAQSTRSAGRLTARQHAVLMHMKLGSANKIIAHELGMSENTVKVHVRNIMRRVGATNRTQAVYNALRLRENAGFSLSSDL